MSNLTDGHAMYVSEVVLSISAGILHRLIDKYDADQLKKSDVIDGLTTSAVDIASNLVIRVHEAMELYTDVSAAEEKMGDSDDL